MGGRMECSAHSRKCVCRIVTGSVPQIINLMKLSLTKQEVLFLHKLLYDYRQNLSGHVSSGHENFVGKLSKKIKRQFKKEYKI